MQEARSGLAAARATECARSLHHAIRSLAMARAESQTQRECLVAHCTEVVLGVIEDEGDLVVLAADGQLELAGHRLPAGPEIGTLETSLARAGLRAIRFRLGLTEAELRAVLDLLADPIATLDPRSSLDLWERARATDLPHVRLSCRSGTSRDGHQPASGGHANGDSGDMAASVCQSLIEDLETCPPGSPYRERAVHLCASLLARLVESSRLDAVVGVLDLLVARGLGEADRSTLLASLAPLRGQRGAAEILRLSARHPLLTLVALVRHLGSATVQDLLESTLDADAPPAASLLKALVGTDPGLFVTALDADREIVRERALRLLQRARHCVPLDCLEALALSGSPPLRARALECLADQYPQQFSVSRALGLLADASEDVRAVALHRLAQLGDPTALAPLRAWLHERVATMTPSERARAEQALALLAAGT